MLAIKLPIAPNALSATQLGIRTLFVGNTVASFSSRRFLLRFCHKCSKFPAERTWLEFPLIFPLWHASCYYFTGKHKRLNIYQRASVAKFQLLSKKAATIPDAYAESSFSS